MNKKLEILLEILKEIIIVSFRFTIYSLLITIIIYLFYLLWIEIKL